MAQKTLYLMMGYPGAGKTTTAKIIHKLTGAVHLWADQIRNERYKNPTHSHQENLELYDYLNELTAELLRTGQSVIFDTNFNFLRDRDRLRKIAREHNAKTVLVWVQTPKEISKQRATRLPEKHENRIWGNMPVKDFDRIANNQEKPRPDENALVIDGEEITQETVKKALEL